MVCSGGRLALVVIAWDIDASDEERLWHDIRLSPGGMADVLLSELGCSTMET